MNSRERILIALDHREPDRIPFDLGSIQVTGIHEIAYRNLRQALGLPETRSNLCDTIQRLATIEDDLAERLGIDLRGLYPLNSHNWGINEEDAGEYWAYHDEWGITHHRPKERGLYYSIVDVPLPRFDITEQEIEGYRWPDMGARWRVEGLREQAEQYRAAGYAVILKDAFAGIFEFAQRVVGMENLLLMMGIDEKKACTLFDKMLDLKLAYWRTALEELGDLVDVAVQAAATGMDLADLKRDFGQDLVFWGGGVDTQGILPNGTPQEVKDDVKRNIDVLAAGGGYVFNTVHNIQADVPPENILAMWEALQEYGAYR